jgi:hypothetical protein
MPDEGSRPVVRATGPTSSVCSGSLEVLQRSVPNVSFVFSDVRCRCFYLDVVYVSHIGLQVFYLDQVLHPLPHLGVSSSSRC